MRRKLRKLGFEQEKPTGGSHEKWRAAINRKLRKVTLDCHKGEVRALDVKSIIGRPEYQKNSGMMRDLPAIQIVRF